MKKPIIKLDGEILSSDQFVYFFVSREYRAETDDYLFYCNFQTQKGKRYQKIMDRKKFNLFWKCCTKIKRNPEEYTNENDTKNRREQQTVPSGDQNHI